MNTKFKDGDFVQSFNKGIIVKEKGIFRIESYEGGIYQIRNVKSGKLMKANEANLIKYEVGSVGRAEQPRPTDPAKFNIRDRIEIERKGKIIYGTITKIKFEEQKAQVELDEKLNDKTEYTIPFDKLKKSERIKSPKPVSPKRASPKPVSPKRVCSKYKQEEHNINYNSKQFEDKTNNQSRLLDAGYVKKAFNYLSKIFKDKTIVFVSQNGLKMYMKNKYNIILFRCPDEAYIIEHNTGKKVIKILEKKNQNVEGSTETKLWSGPSLKREYELVLGNEFEVHYGFCVSEFLKKKLTSTEKNIQH